MEIFDRCVIRQHGIYVVGATELGVDFSDRFLCWARSPLAIWDRRRLAVISIGQKILSVIAGALRFLRYSETGYAVVQL